MLGKYIPALIISLLNLWQILKSKLDRVKSSGLPRKRNHELAMTPLRHPGNL